MYLWVLLLCLQLMLWGVAQLHFILHYTPFVLLYGCSPFRPLSVLFFCPRFFQLPICSCCCRLLAHFHFHPAGVMATPVVEVLQRLLQLARSGCFSLSLCMCRMPRTPFGDWFALHLSALCVLRCGWAALFRPYHCAAAVYRPSVIVWGWGFATWWCEPVVKQQRAVLFPSLHTLLALFAGSQPRG